MIERHEVIATDRDVLGGVPVFRGTRVPVRSLLDYLAAGSTLSEFLSESPSVSREQAQAVLDLASEALTAGASSS
jgi:uncharacterized protein (DUF433 family)